VNKVEVLLLIIVALLLLVVAELRNVNRRLKEGFPTEEEQDFAWSQTDPHGHSQAHKDDKLLKKEKK
jgi:hypothetical protein